MVVERLWSHTKHSPSFESRVTYKQQSQPGRALFRLIVAISSSSVGTSPFPLKCLWPIRFQWHSDVGPGQIHNEHWQTHSWGHTYHLDVWKKERNKSWPTTSVTYSLLSAQWQYISQCSIISCPQIWSHGSFIWKEIALLLHFQWGEKALKDIKQNEYRCSSSAKSAVFAHSVSSSNRKRCLGAMKDILVLTAFRPCKQKSISLFLHMMDDLTIRACLWIPTRELTCHHLSFILLIKAPRNR